MEAAMRLTGINSALVGRHLLTERRKWTKTWKTNVMLPLGLHQDRCWIQSSCAWHSPPQIRAQTLPVLGEFGHLSMSTAAIWGLLHIPKTMTESMNTASATKQTGFSNILDVVKWVKWNYGRRLLLLRCVRLQFLSEIRIVITLH